MKKLVIIADLGTLRAFRTHQGELEQTNHLAEIEGPRPPPAPEPLHEQVSDQAGRFPSGAAQGTAGGMGYGERHTKLQEEQRRHIKMLAELIEQVVRAERCETWQLVAPSEINNRLVYHLSEPVRERLLLNIHANLSKLPLAEIEARLLSKTPGGLST